ncbi:MAG: hypothetical protein AAF828_12585, partial [Bacteroidota bacterium]
MAEPSQAARDSTVGEFQQSYRAAAPSGEGALPKSGQSVNIDVHVSLQLAIGGAGAVGALQSL